MSISHNELMQSFSLSAFIYPWKNDGGQTKFKAELSCCQQWNWPICSCQL